jgi:hypothetical protein
LNYSIPVLSVLEAGKETLEKDGVRISLAAQSYVLSRPAVRREFKRTSLAVAPKDNLVNVVETPVSTQVGPKEIKFKLKISNRLDRVLRLAGAVVQWQVAGKAVSVDKSGSQELLSGIILPRQEGEFDVFGPDWASLPDKSTIALFLYDVVTATDAAGNPTKRSNFEFLYTISRQEKQDSFPIVRKQVGVSQLTAQELDKRGASVLGQFVPCARDQSGRASPPELCS